MEKKQTFKQQQQQQQQTNKQTNKQQQTPTQTKTSERKVSVISPMETNCYQKLVAKVKNC